MVSVKQIYIYPIKSMQGIALNSAIAVDGGFQHDRILMVSEPDGTFITAREYPELLQLKISITEDEVHISHSKTQSISINFSEFSNSYEPTEVWGNYFTSHIAPIKVNRFLSDFLNKNIQLRWIGNVLSRRTKRYPRIPLSFADSYPYLLLNQTSFDYLQQLCPEKLDITQFRGNIIIEGSLPFAEDGWKTIKIGNVIFDIVKPCSRCVLTTINTKSNQCLSYDEPIKTLRYFRMDEQGEIDFGMNMIARNKGIISLNDPIEVLVHQSAKNYIKSSPPENNNQVQTCMITFQGKMIKGNNKQTILEQLEQHKIQLPNSCRVGICGRCQVELKKGEITPMIQSAVRRNNKILACNCIPNGDITIGLIKK